MVPFDRWSPSHLAQLQLADAGQGLAEQVVHGDDMNQGRIQPCLEVVPVHLGDLTPGRFQLKLPTQTEGRIQPPAREIGSHGGTAAFGPV